MNVVDYDLQKSLNLKASKVSKPFTEHSALVDRLDTVSYCEFENSTKVKRLDTQSLPNEMNPH